jgi:diguanylate cyclase (GGDEF)-like protein
VDDSTVIRQPICHTLSTAGYRVVEAADGCAALEMSRRARPDLVLLGIDLPGLDGHETLRAMRADSDLRSVPVLFLSDLHTSCEPAELIARVDMALRTKSTEDALARQARETNDLSSIDVLTGIPNRQRMEARILELAAMHGPNAVATVVMVAIDDFKSVNYTFGQAVGDTVVRIVAARLRGAVVDERVLLCRWGDERFLAAGIGLDSNEAHALAEQLSHAVSATPFAIGVDQTMPVTASVGCATGTLDMYAAVLEAAAGALSEAKRAGGDRLVYVVVSSPRR